MAKSPDLYQREWAPLDQLEASALLTSTTAKIRFTDTGMIVELWFPWIKTPHKKESTDASDSAKHDQDS